MVRKSSANLDHGATKITYLEIVGFVLAVFIRVFLLFFGSWQDDHFEVKYTDVDYFVITDAAKYVAAGMSPYDRPTYRYTPLLSYLFLGNIYLFRSFVKLVLLVVDILVALLILVLFEKLKAHGYFAHEKVKSTAYVFLWLLNPFVINVSSRGNIDSLMSLLVLLCLLFMLTDEIGKSAFCFGLSVHMKIYPLIYLFAFLIFLEKKNSFDGLKNRQYLTILEDFFTKRSVKFATISFSTFAALTGIFYILYGNDFIYETYLYHLVRKDNRHNFSVYFYYLYLSSSMNYLYPIISNSLLEYMKAFLLFIPQIALIIAASYWLYYDIIFCMFVLTTTFVMFNKVITVQYFIWYFCFFPLVFPNSNMKAKDLLLLLTLWLVSQSFWLYFAYQLEFLCEHTFLQTWIMGLLFFAVNVFCLVKILEHQNLSLGC